MASTRNVFFLKGNDIFLVGKYVIDIRLSQNLAPGLLESIAKPSRPVKNKGQYVAYDSQEMREGSRGSIWLHNAPPGPTDAL